MAFPAIVNSPYMWDILLLSPSTEKFCLPIVWASCIFVLTFREAFLIVDSGLRALCAPPGGIMRDITHYVVTAKMRQTLAFLQDKGIPFLNKEEKFLWWRCEW